ncbi:hypothetical protein PoB_005928500 [Plakobranchus ocellatus]|uniref:Integrase catalytic domain-containing protein n=1 Tax=Plakobranchus ocellatus TaxID=259542 RepID=A0AAV4CLC9_9GAST|nr:hypothetical protein PoB_005928500 [Plakobranchus ocellatus]
MRFSLAEITFHLDIFILFDAPFFSKAISDPSCFTSHEGSLAKTNTGAWLALPSPSQESVERTNGDIKDMLVAWIADYDSSLFSSRKTVLSILG